MRVIFMGTPQFAVPSLESLVANRHQVAAVYTQPDRTAGRGRSLVAPPVKIAAQNLNLAVLQPDSLKDTGTVAQLAAFHPDVIVVAAFGQLLPSSVLAIPRYGCVNIHPSLLPRFRGASPVAAAILAGDELTGVSIMLMERGLDTGPILAQETMPISQQDTTGSLTDKLSRLAAQLLPPTLESWLRGEITPLPQNDAGATYSGQITREDGRIDWHLSAADIWRRVRAFNPWPGCYTSWRGKQLKIIEALPLPGKSSLTAGQVVALDKEDVAFGVGTGDGILGVQRLQMEGKRVVSAAEFLRGQREFMGAVLIAD